MTYLRGVPNAGFARAFLVDGALTWVFIRLALLFVAVVGGNAGSVISAPGLSLGLPGSITMVTLCGAVVVLDVLRRRESILLANLGIPLRAAFITGAIPATIAESAMSVIAGMVAA